MTNLTPETIPSRQIKRVPGTCRVESKAAAASLAVVRYTIHSCPLGRLLLAATDCGVCVVCIGADDGALETELAQRCPTAKLCRDDAGLRPWADDVLGHINGGPAPSNPPIDIRGTAFQRRVWQELLAIPPGRTRSYSEVARLLGRPTAARAVARACATNPVAVLIPCHRVVREGGGLGGYRWGLERKKALLEAERTATRLTGRCGPPAGGSGA